MIILFGLVILAVFIGSMLARKTTTEQFDRGVIRARATAGYIVLFITALALIGAAMGPTKHHPATHQVR